MGWWRPREVSGPTRLSHSRGSCHPAAKVSASRTDCITRPRGEGLGLNVDWRLKVFCPAFLQKSGRGPGAEPLDARRSARNSLVLHKAQEGVKGGTLAGGPPFAGGLSRPQPLRRRGAGGERRKGSSRTPTPTGLVRRHGVCGHPGVRAGVEPRPYGGWRNVVGLAMTVTAGRRGRRPLQGGCGTGRVRRRKQVTCKTCAPSPGIHTPCKGRRVAPLPRSCKRQRRPGAGGV